MAGKEGRARPAKPWQTGNNIKRSKIPSGPGCEDTGQRLLGGMRGATVPVSGCLEAANNGFGAAVASAAGSWSAKVPSLLLFCLKRLSRHYLPPVAASGEKDESEVRTSRTIQKGVRRRTQSICTAQEEPQCEVWLQLQRAGFTYDGQACSSRPPASPCGNQSTLKVERKVERRLQPKVGRLAHQAAAELGSAGWAKSSREQAPACYTSAGHQANRRETGVALRGDQGSTRSHAARRATRSLAQSTEAAPGLWSEVQKAAKGREGKQPRASRPPAKWVLPAGSSQCTMLNSQRETTAEHSSRTPLALKG